MKNLLLMILFSLVVAETMKLSEFITVYKLVDLNSKKIIYISSSLYNAKMSSSVAVTNLK